MTTRRLREIAWTRLRSAFGRVAVQRLLLALILAQASLVRATGTGMPWESPLEAILGSVQGPVARIMAVMTIIGTESISAVSRPVTVFVAPGPEVTSTTPGLPVARA